MINGVIRSIGGFTADVTIEEDSTDELAITRNPVEQGADITDHSYKEPAVLTVRAGWTDSSLLAAGDQNYSASIYAQLLALQESRALFVVQTGQRNYPNMLMRSLRKITDESTEHGLICDITLQQVIVVPTEVSSIGSTANQKMPQQTAPTTTLGTKSLQPAPNYNGGPI